MKKVLTLILGLILAINISVRADEGMWLLNLLQKTNAAEMKSMGLELTPDQIYSINHSSLKDAVGALDRGSCTSELVSSEGLLLTNHHCGYGEIQSHSSVEHDYLKNGFWAMTREEELPNPGKTVSFVIRIEDVTDQIAPKLQDGVSGMVLDRTVDNLSKDIVKKATEGTNYEAFVRSFFNGNKFYLVVLETYRDVRLVGAPPESIGKFGADTDNWMWPRHTGDFSIFRVYTAPDGSPADYSPDNVPLKPKYYLPVSLKGYDMGSFAMVMGYPGSTDRYMTSFEVNEILSIEHPNRIKIRGIKQDIMLKDMQADEKVRIQYASKYSRSTNYWKYSIGQSEGLKRLNVVQRKQETEAAFTKWLNETPERKAKYGNVLSMIEEGVAGRKEYSNARQYAFEAMYQGMEVVTFAYQFSALHNLLQELPDNRDSIMKVADALEKRVDNFYKDYNLPTDKKIFRAMLELFYNDVPVQYQPDNFAVIRSKYKGNLDKYTDMFYSKSIFPYREKLEAFLANPSLKVMDKDPAFQAATSMINSIRADYQAAGKFDAMVDQGRKLWMEGLMEMMPDKKFYPDANSTLRLTYGTVGDYQPRDAVRYSYYTTLSGVMEKEDPNNWEFVVSDRLKKLYKDKDYGRYGVNGELPVCFTTNNDITGGNSGSPVMNSKGELIGIAFDGNWEAMSGDIAFEPELQKCINVDIRYVLFVIDKYAGAGHLVDEMTIVQ
ncbi:MAG: S46 family peptidase [Bacteroidales bacterium]|nr:S46 family peptidase [Bacteroidales bacterium]MCB8999178.1 S46 family peptidase [Bacteroidales bacterium]